MTWKKHFTPVSNIADIDAITNAGHSLAKAGPARTNYSSYLPDVYSGSPNRIDRYQQYEVMDSDPEINAALDILAEFCTQKLKDGKGPFSVKWRSKATNSEIKILGEYLQQWNKLQQFDTRAFRIVRNVFKYGDAFFIRDPETQKWQWIDSSKIVKVIVNESDGKKPQQYIIKDLAPNFENLVVTQITPNINTRQSHGGIPTSGAMFGGSTSGSSNSYSSGSGARFGLSDTEYAIDAAHVVHLSLSEGLDNNFPFGNSLLENVYKTYKQKELIEDAVLIYRIQRAPERRVFHIDVGNMPPHLAMSFVERVKNEIHQRRIPSQSGGGCFPMDTLVPLTDGRTLSIAEIAVELDNGIELWAYSCDPESGDQVPGLITWAGITHDEAEVLELTLSNGNNVICTPEHPFPVYDKGKTEAQDLRLHIDRIIEYTDLGIASHVTVVSCKPIKEKYTVGTLTIDGNEVYHNYHTFAIEQGVYAYNSNVIDSAFNPMSQNEDFFFPRSCLSLDTKVKLLDDRDVTLADLIKEFEEGKVNYTYTVNNTTLDYEPGKIVWAGVTRKQATVVEVEIDNGEKIICTPDHRFIMRDGSEVEAGLLESGDSLMPLLTSNLDNSQVVKVEAVTILDYVIDTGDLTIESESDSHNFALSCGIVVHNSEGRGSDVTTLPGGCFAMDTKVLLLDGRELSIKEIEDELKTNKELWTYSCNPDTGAVVPGVISWAGVTHKSAQVMKLVISDGYSTAEIICTPDHKMVSANGGFKQAQDLVVGESLMSLSRGKHENDSRLNYYDNADKEWYSLSDITNPDKQTTDLDADPLIVTITAIEFLEDEIEVGTLTIDQDEKYHNYHTFALSCGIFTKNSNIGEITDLRYFTNKLFRGLRIPSSYLPTGEEDSQANFNDGRVGTAYIQELRFNKYCERLQSLITEKFDTEFKMYMYSRGVNIDSNLFELEFNPPMNFASARQSALDSERINTFNTVQAIPYMSNRFALKRFLGLSDDEVAENERYWAEENGRGTAMHTDAAGELRSSGLSAAGIQGDLSSFGDMSAPPEVAPPEQGAAPGATPTMPAAPPA